jgi:hypothetical protein
MKLKGEKQFRALLFSLQDHLFWFNFCSFRTEMKLYQAFVVIIQAQ